VKIAIGSDHAGFELKQLIGPILKGEGHAVIDLGPQTDEPVDYPLFAEKVAREVADGNADRAVLICGSGVGVCIAANKVDGVRAVNAHDPEEAEMSRRHNDANVLCLAGRRLGTDAPKAIIESFMKTDFEGGRHQRRVDQIGQVERHHAPAH